MPYKMSSGSELWIPSASGRVINLNESDQYSSHAYRTNTYSWGILGAKGDVTNFILCSRDQYYLNKAQKKTKAILRT